MDINVSQILDFQRCELDWHYKWVRRRIRRGWGPVYFQTGIWWHRLMEHYFHDFDVRNGWKPNPISSAIMSGVEDMISMALEAEAALSTQKQISEFRSDCQKLLDLFGNHWVLKYPPTTIHSVEEIVRKQLPDSDHFIIGIPDTVISTMGRRWHLQHKTASERTDRVLYVNLAQRSLHELIYAWLLDADESYGGTYLNLILKLSLKAQTSNPKSAFVQELIPLDPVQIDRALRDVSRLIDRMHAIVTGAAEPIDNREADTNNWRNALSPYFDVKLGVADLDDDSLFMDHVSRYEQTPESDKIPEHQNSHAPDCRCRTCDPDYHLDLREGK